MTKPTQRQHRYMVKLFQQVGPVWVNTFSYQKWAHEGKEFVFTAGPLRYQVERVAGGSKALSVSGNSEDI